MTTNNTHKKRASKQQNDNEMANTEKEDKMNGESSICLGYLIVLVIKPTAHRERHPERHENLNRYNDGQNETTIVANDRGRMNESS